MTDNPRNDDMWALAARMADMERRLALVERRAETAEQALLDIDDRHPINPQESGQ